MTSTDREELLRLRELAEDRKLPGLKRLADAALDNDIPMESVLCFVDCVAGMMSNDMTMEDVRNELD